MAITKNYNYTQPNGLADLEAGLAAIGASVLPYTWATKPAAADNQGIVIRITDVGGSAGSRWISDGTYWKPESGRIVLGAGGAAASCAADTAENVLATVTVPALAMGANGILSIVTTWSYTNSANNKTPRVRYGGAAGDLAFSTTFTTSASARYWTEIQNRNGTASQVCGTSNGNSILAGPINGAITTFTRDSSAAQDIVISGQKASAGETLTLERYSVELIVP